MKTRRFLKIFSVTLVILVFGFVTINSGAAAQPKYVKIGYLFPMTGPIAKWGITSKIAVEIACEDINGLNNEKGIIVGGQRYLITPVIYDCEGKADKSLDGLKRFATLEKIPAAVGPFTSPEALALLPQIEKLNILMFSHVYARVAAKGNPLVLNYLASPKALVPIYTNLIVKEGIKTVAIIYDKAPSFVDWQNVFAKEFEARGGKIVGSEKMDIMTTTDFYAVLTKYRAMNPDALLPIGSAEPIGLIYKQAREIGYKGRFLGSAEITPSTLKTAGVGNMKGTIFPGFNLQACATENPPSELRNFLKRFKEKGKGMETAGSELLDYDQTILIALGMEKAGTILDPQKIRQGIMGVARERGTKVTMMPSNGFTKGGQTYGETIYLFRIEENGSFEIIPGSQTLFTREEAEKEEAEQPK
jgi:branched-chain amino acid transport system substrate-binding protein